MDPDAAAIAAIVGPLPASSGVAMPAYIMGGRYARAPGHYNDRDARERLCRYMDSPMDYVFRLAKGVLNRLMRVREPVPVTQPDFSPVLKPHAKAFARIRDQYLQALLDTKPCDRQVAETIITSLYEQVGHPRPVFLWVDSPMQAVIASSLSAWVTLEPVSQDPMQIRLNSWERRLLAIEPNTITMCLADKIVDRSVPAYRTLSDWRLRSALVRDYLGALSPSVQMLETVFQATRHDVLMKLRDRKPLDIWFDTWHRINVSNLPVAFAESWNAAAEMLWLLEDQDHLKTISGLVRAVTDLSEHPLFNYGQFDAHWVAEMECLRLLGNDFPPTFDIYKKSVIECGMWCPLKNVCVISDRPQELHVDASTFLHQPYGMALRYGDNSGLYSIHGVRVSEDIAMRRFSAAQIEAERNIEIRRAMIDMYGAAEFLHDSGAQEIHKDEFGVLYRKEIPGDEPVVMVEVLNTTAEPDGTHKKYFLRVPPDIRTARQAVAWSFDMNPEDYQPVIES